MKHRADDSGVVSDTYMGDITEGLKFVGGIKVGDVISPLFLPFMTLYKCENKNDDNDGDIYNNDYIPHHEYHL